MKISEFIEKLKAFQEEHGDLEVEAQDTGCGCCAGNNAAPAISLETETINEPIPGARNFPFYKKIGERKFAEIGI